LQTDTKPSVALSEDVKVLREARRNIHLHEQKLVKLNVYLEDFNEPLKFTKEYLTTMAEFEEAGVKINEGGNFYMKQAMNMISVRCLHNRSMELHNETVLNRPP
jgi:hypothetical protein